MSASVGSLGAELLGQPEVEHLHAPVVTDHHIGRFQIAMDDAFVVRGGKRVRHRRRDVHDPIDRHSTVRDRTIERLPFDQLHREKVNAGVFLNREDGDDVRMIEGGEGFGFAAETIETLAFRRHVGENHFQGDGTSEFRVGRAIDLPHSAGANRTDDLIVAEPRADS